MTNFASRLIAAVKPDTQLAQIVDKVMFDKAMASMRRKGMKIK